MFKRLVLSLLGFHQDVTTPSEEAPVQSDDDCFESPPEEDPDELADAADIAENARLDREDYRAERKEFEKEQRELYFDDSDEDDPDGE